MINNCGKQTNQFNVSKVYKIAQGKANGMPELATTAAEKLLGLDNDKMGNTTVDTELSGNKHSFWLSRHCRPIKT